jgi:hypothetical protein
MAASFYEVQRNKRQTIARPAVRGEDEASEGSCQKTKKIAFLKGFGFFLPSE